MKTQGTWMMAAAVVVGDTFCQIGHLPSVVRSIDDTGCRVVLHLADGRCVIRPSTRQVQIIR